MQQLTNTIKSHKKAWLLALFGLAIITTLLLAIALPKLELSPGEDLPLAEILALLSSGESGLNAPDITVSYNLVRLFIACVWILIIASVIGFIVSPEIRKDIFKRLIRYSLIILAIYGLVVTAAPHIPPLTQNAEGGESSPFGLDDPAKPFPDPPDFVVNPPPWVVYSITILLIIFLLGLAWFVWYAFFKPEEEEAPWEELTQEAQQALDDIKAGRNLKDTIMKCYADMSDTLRQQRNIQRAEGMTPREFEQYLANSGFKTEDIKRLTRLFERVRYGSKTPGSKEEQEAIACLSAIIYTYESSS